VLVKVAAERVVLGLEVRLERRIRRVVGCELDELREVDRAALQVPPRRDLLAQRVSAAKDALCGLWVVPEVGAARLSLELGEVVFALS
jgi:hypothetical protein